MNFRTLFLLALIPVTIPMIHLNANNITEQLSRHLNSRPSGLTHRIPHDHDDNPTKYPTKYPTKFPTKYPSPFPTNLPTSNPTRKPTRNPTRKPTPQPMPTNLPSYNPIGLCPPGTHRHRDEGSCVPCHSNTYNHGGMHRDRDQCYSIPPKAEFEYLNSTRKNHQRNRLIKK